MIPVFVPVKKLRRSGKCLLFGAIVLVGAVAVYNEIVAAGAWRSGTSMNGETDSRSWRRAKSDEWVKMDKREQPNYAEDPAVWISGHTPQTWKPEYMGQANLHVFEDWCGSTTAELRKNPHYPLYPHSRATVQKLAVSPQWTNYGLRIFGYLHPYADGEMLFALASNDNSEFWLSTDDSPHNLQLLAWVGKTGTEWTAPGEFEKYVSQISRPVRLSAQRRYFFEVVHKQNYKGTDHVEVAWQLLDQDIGFMIIESKHISLYVNESAVLMSDVAHIPQTAAGHQITTKQRSAAIDMLREDPRDVFYQVPLVNSKFLQGVLPDCPYKPSYTIKDYPLLRYQGLQFVHMSYIYPNDFTRLTHMETESSCFYPESNYHMRMFGFSGYMRLDRPDMHKKENAVRDFGFAGKKSIFYEEDEFDNDTRQREREARPDPIDNALFPDYGDDFDDYTQKRRRKLFSVVQLKTNNTQKPDKPQKTAPTQASVHHLQQPALKQEGPLIKAQPVKPKGKRLTNRKVNSVKSNVGPKKANHSMLASREQMKTKERPVVQSQQVVSKRRHNQRPALLNQTRTQRRKAPKLQSLEQAAHLPEKPTVAKRRTVITREVTRQSASNRRFTTVARDIDAPLVRLNQRDAGVRKDLGDEDTGKIMPLQQDFKKGNYVPRDKMDTKWLDMKIEDHQVGRKDDVRYRGENQRESRQRERDSLWGAEGEFDGADDEDLTPAPVFDAEVNWSQTFQVNRVDLQALRSDWIDLHCNVSGNLLLHPRDALPTVTAFMEQLNKKHHGRFTLVRVVNVVKREDRVQGNRYLVELELKDASGRLLRLSQYIYALIRHSRQRGRPLDWRRRRQPELVLCNPVGFHWNPLATVHFIVPVKNQARWVQMLIADMERLFTETGDTNFNLIITDYNSTDMDVRKALQKSSLPRYQYVKLSGNFERSAGLQAGVDLINDNHSIVFLCDLHIHFPPSIIDTIRKHCVEGHMAFAPIVMRLDCGSTPREARGYWEVNGFGLLGIYKSDLVAIGGMNTREFTDRWGGEDWELLDRILQAGLEVERIYLRNFFHYYHSKRGMWNRRTSPSHM